MQLARQRRILPLVPFSSLADMAFLLLVFFLLSSHFTNDEAPSVRLPRAETSLTDELRRPVRFFLEPAGRLGIQGSAWSMDLSRITERGTHELEQKIKDLLPTGKPAPTLAADAQCPYFLVRRALGLLERAGIHSLAFTLEAGP